jgi:hypothetical protein
MLNVNFDVLTNFVTKRPYASVSLMDAHKITRVRETVQLTTKWTKDYKLVFDKRVITKNYVSYPYGF